MSELPDDSVERKKKLKELILKLHAGEEEQKVRQALLESLSRIPYGEVVEVEQELIRAGLPEAEVSQDIKKYRAVSGEKRILSYAGRESS